LLEELILDQFGNLESGLLVFAEGVLTNQLHDFDQVVLLLQDVLDGELVPHEVWVSSVVVFLKFSVVVGERDVPVHGREMLSLGEFLVQTPEDLYDIEGGSSDWIREITTWWRYGTNNRDGTDSVWGSEARDFTGSFIELGQFGSQMCWET